MLESVNHWRDGGVASLARRMVPELRAGDAPGRMALHGLVLEALALAVRSGRRRTRDPLPAWLRTARDLVHDRYRERLELGQIAHEVGVEPTRLARAFRAGFGVPLGTYQRKLRLDWAADQVASTGEPLSRIALRAGFYDQAHFTRHFRDHTGRPPGAYRRLYRHRSGRAAPLAR
jgi:AraC family transcriptional regulator